MGCRFRVWAPNASRVQVVLDSFSNAPAFDLGLEQGTGNWSADEVKEAGAGRKYQYLITNKGGPDNNDSVEWHRTDARATSRKFRCEIDGIRGRSIDLHHLTSAV
jgi:1,4-alpha-glucan branching enzyme